ncbi:acyl-CoA reductase [uncultured Selenomonas sp.]|uniref:acyl-CoA reductase n=1 Tax=uncultured Selenomonas sp. TaxID=159275 RepID=UPI0028E79DB6|nr:acyl-CoA reductase [uncultured Selenomonas sp.]
MRQHFDGVTYVLGGAESEARMVDVRPLPIFSEEAVAFLVAFSARILADAEAKAYPDVVTLGFWCRPAALRQMQKLYDAERNRVGRGIVFHIAPSNVAVNFAYSCLAAFLAGNASIVRLPSKDFPQVDVLCRIFAETLAEFPTLFPYFLFVRYGHVQEVNEYYSRMCQTRVIWGGDATIGAIRHAALSPRTNEITFADRHSLAVIDAPAYLAAEDKERIAQDFYNDTYLSDQNACTAPRFVVWLGAAEKVKAAQDLFWRTLHTLVRERYTLQGVQAVDKLTQLYRLGVHAAAQQIPMEDNLITRVCVAELTEKLAAYKAGSGFFIEYAAQEIAELRPLCGASCQTLSYYGVERDSLLRAVLAMRPAGVDRIVPMGRTMDFALVWDGVDLIRTMSRVVQVI